ncbi:MAG: hypothetical protein ACLP9C_03130 [Acidimicrobiales bacterium]
MGFIEKRGQRYPALRARLNVRARKGLVTEQLVRLRTGEWLPKEPKSSLSVRSITIFSVTTNLLADHLKRFAAAGPEGIVFPTPPATRCSLRASGAATSHRRSAGPV